MRINNDTMRPVTVFCNDIGSSKVKCLSLSADSAAMAYAACLKKEYNNIELDLEGEQQAHVFQNSLYISLLQLSLILLIWWAYFDAEFFVI